MFSNHYRDLDLLKCSSSVFVRIVFDWLCNDIDFRCYYVHSWRFLITIFFFFSFNTTILQSSLTINVQSVRESVFVGTLLDLIKVSVYLWQPDENWKQRRWYHKNGLHVRQLPAIEWRWIWHRRFNVSNANGREAL